MVARQSDYDGTLRSFSSYLMLKVAAITAVPAVADICSHISLHGAALRPVRHAAAANAVGWHFLELSRAEFVFRDSVGLKSQSCDCVGRQEGIARAVLFIDRSAAKLAAQRL